MVPVLSAAGGSQCVHAYLPLHGVHTDGAHQAGVRVAGYGLGWPVTTTVRPGTCIQSDSSQNDHIQ
ncbi:hypothetical protein DPMN_094891 [Dreissena polymorpha]|uniref:Uncharacterized protein n=1 Tax=Dreissena polymorpha TaxID=45954 RepID=A0A9D4L6V2_DREPO|nr:hypothetical protein DPMN_094891 [Dreissena polymorpha]